MLDRFLEARDVLEQGLSPLLGLLGELSCVSHTHLTATSWLIVVGGSHRGHLRACSWYHRRWHTLRRIRVAQEEGSGIFEIVVADAESKEGIIVGITHLAKHGQSFIVWSEAGLSWAK